LLFEAIPDFSNMEKVSTAIPSALGNGNRLAQNRYKAISKRIPSSIQTFIIRYLFSALSVTQTRGLDFVATSRIPQGNFNAKVSRSLGCWHYACWSAK
jgi:hypothetical protein